MPEEEQTRQEFRDTIRAASLAKRDETLAKWAAIQTPPEDEDVPED